MEKHGERNSLLLLFLSPYSALVLLFVLLLCFAWCILLENKTRGAVKKKMTKATYICRSINKKVVAYFILFLFYFYFYRFFLSRF
jgi:hypothetical protein